MAKILNKAFIGCEFTIKKPISVKVVIENDPSKFDYYAYLGLDIFEKKVKMTFPKHDSDKKKPSKRRGPDTNREADADNA